MLESYLKDLAELVNRDCGTANSSISGKAPVADSSRPINPAPKSTTFF